MNCPFCQTPANRKDKDTYARCPTCKAALYFTVPDLETAFCITFFAHYKGIEYSIEYFPEEDETYIKIPSHHIRFPGMPLTPYNATHRLPTLLTFS